MDTDNLATQLFISMRSVCERICIVVRDACSHRDFHIARNKCYAPSEARVPVYGCFTLTFLFPNSRRT